jgi:hypothetical protein
MTCSVDDAPNYFLQWPGPFIGVAGPKPPRARTALMLPTPPAPPKSKKEKAPPPAKAPPAQAELF